MSQINDLLEDPEFIRWVKYPESKLNKYWQSWMEANPERIADVKLVREIILGLQFPSREAHEDVKREVLNRLLLVSNFTEVEETPKKSSQMRIFAGGWGQMLKVAAILVVTVLLPLFFYSLQKSEELTEVASQKWITKSTNRGEKLTFRLPDGTMVWLNSGSSLTYPEVFDSAFRHVQLRGEGFFEVAKDVNKPFKVASEGLVTTALGTSFNINAKHQDDLKVSLLTGKVAIRYESDSSAYFLIPGEELRFQKSQMGGVVGTFDADRVMGWRFGRLIFQKATFSRVIEDLEAWYGVEFNIAGKPRSEWSLNGMFEDQSLENVLRSISNIEGFSYQVEGKKVKIQF